MTPAIEAMIRQLLLVAVLMTISIAHGQSADLGIFTGHADVGDVAKPGSIAFSPATGEYEIAGGGANMWSTADAFHFLWKQMSGDCMLTADVRILGTEGNPHRKACLLIRQSLTADSAYVDVALHGNGLTALQYRDAAGAVTHTIHSNISAPEAIAP